MIHKLELFVSVAVPTPVHWLMGNSLIIFIYLLSMLTCFVWHLLLDMYLHIKASYKARMCVRVHMRWHRFLESLPLQSVFGLIFTLPRSRDTPSAVVGQPVWQREETWNYNNMVKQCANSKAQLQKNDTKNEKAVLPAGASRNKTNLSHTKHAIICKEWQ